MVIIELQKLKNMKQIIKGAVYKQNDGTMYRMHHVDDIGLIYYSEAIIANGDIDFDVTECGIGLFGQHGDRLCTPEEEIIFKNKISSQKTN